MTLPAAGELGGPPGDYFVLAPSSMFLRNGFWVPGTQTLYSKLWDALHARKLRFWSDISRQFLVHAEDMWEANHLLERFQRERALAKP